MKNSIGNFGHSLGTFKNPTQMFFYNQFKVILMFFIEKSLDFMASALGATFGKEQVGVRFTRLAPSLPQVFSMKD
jgi:hypothetical protein